MKTRILLAGLFLVASSYSNATAVCTGSDTAGAKSVSAGAFIKEAFNMNCSKNVFLDYSETATVVAVCAASKKGKNSFGGSSDGGSVSAAGACAGDGCVVGDATSNTAKAGGCANGS